MNDPYDHDERLAIQEADGIFQKPECEAARKLEVHRLKVIADKAERHAKKYGADRKTLGGGL